MPSSTRTADVYKRQRLLTNLIGATPCQAELVSAQGYEPFGSLLPGRNYSSDSYRFGFNGMPKDDEVHNATGTSYDFGARLYDPRVGRWLSTDPHAAKYPSFSPYNAFANNPLIFVDVDGRDIVIAKSVSAADRDAIVSAMQKLTNDKLVMIQLADGAIKVLAPTRTDGDKVKGTDMLRSLIDSEHTTTIQMSNSSFTAPTAQVTDAPALKEEQQWTDGTGADATVRLASTNGVEGTLVQDRATGAVRRETSSFEMILGHELIHALRGVLGVATDGYIDATITFPDEHGNMQTETYSQDEYEAIGVKGFRSYNGTTENALREEQCIPTDRLSHDEK